MISELRLGDLKREYKAVFDEISKQISEHKQYKHLVTAIDCYFDYKETINYVPCEREQWKNDPIRLMDLIWHEMLDDDAYIYIEYRSLGRRKRKVFTKSVYSKAVKAFKAIMTEIGQPDNTAFDYWQAVRDRENFSCRW